MSVLLFDLDNMLYDCSAVEEATIARMTRFLSERGIALEDETMSAEQELRTRGYAPELVFAFIENTYVASARELIKPDIRLKELLERLVSANNEIGVLTNNPYRYADTALSALGVRYCARHVIGNESLPAPKPHPAAFRTARDIIGVPASCVRFFDDSLKNVEAAASAGLTAYHLPYPGIYDIESLLAKEER